MGRRSDHPGVEQHGPSLRVTFTLHGERCREVVNWAPTPENFAKAAKFRDEIKRRIRVGTFDYAEFFPSSPRAGAKTFMFADVAQEWIDTVEGLAASTLDGYEKILNHHWLPILGQRALGAITPGEVSRAIKKRDFRTAKRRNNCVSVLRMVFAYAVGERYLAESPAADVEFAETQDKEPDPFSLTEVHSILGWLQRNQPTQNYHYFRFAFFSGLRTSELIQLQWSRVDLHSGYVRVDQAKVVGLIKGTKTKKVRDVELNSESRATLTGQKAHTLLADQHVFLNGHTGEPYLDDRAQRKIFYRCLKALGIRQRPAYNTRHTFATMLLMAGSNPYWVSKQLGHSSLETTQRVYARWIRGADFGREVGRLEAFMGQTMGQIGVKKGSEG